MVNGPERIFIERAGHVEAVPDMTLSQSPSKLPSGTSRAD